MPSGIRRPVVCTSRTAGEESCSRNSSLSLSLPLSDGERYPGKRFFDISRLLSISLRASDNVKMTLIPGWRRGSEAARQRDASEEIPLWRIQYQSENADAVDGNRIKWNGRITRLSGLSIRPWLMALMSFNMSGGPSQIFYEDRRVETSGPDDCRQNTTKLNSTNDTDRLVSSSTNGDLI